MAVCAYSQTLRVIVVLVSSNPAQSGNTTEDLVNHRIAAALAVLAAVGLTACAGKSTESIPASAPPAASSTSTAPMVGGMTECTKDALAQPATNAAQSMGPDNVYAISDLHCADGWAVTGGVLANKANPDMGAPTSFVFEQEGQFWIPKDKAKVCGTNPTTTTAPADALIPAALFLPGCAAG